MSKIFDFATVTIFAREFLEGSIIVGEYRTIILRGDSLAPGIQKEDALSEVKKATIGAVAFAAVVIAAVAIPSIVLSNNFDMSTAYIIEGVSKIVAGISLLQLSLELPKFLRVYGSSKNNHTSGQENVGMTLRNIRFNVAWNIWREVAECGVFMIPFFLTPSELNSIPLSAVIGAAVGLLSGYGIYFANARLQDKTKLAIFLVLVLVTLSAGLFTGGCHRLEGEMGSTRLVWELDGDFWSVNRLPLTILKPFGYNNSRTVLEMVCYWSWLMLSTALHYRKYCIASRISNDTERTLEDDETSEPKNESVQKTDPEEYSIELGDSIEFQQTNSFVHKPDLLCKNDSPDIESL